MFRDFPHTVIPNGFPLQEFRPCDRNAARQALCLPMNRKIILFGAACCGNMNKGLHLLLEALPKLATKWQGEPPALVTFGDASGMPTMPPDFECHSLGELKGNAALSCAYSAADVFVLPSMEENLPNVIIEAQACGTPSVGFAIGGIPDIIANPSLGRLAQPYDTNDLADKIREVLMGSPEEAAAYRKDCREHAESAYDQYAQTAAYLKLYRERLGLPEVAPAASAVRLPRVPKGDYADPELRYVDADPFFPCKIIGNANVSHWPWLRREIPHNWYVDCRAPSVGFLSRDEAILLHNAALPFAGENGLEIGCFMGWSACHLALAGLQLDVIDPFLDREVFRGSVTASLTAAGVIDRVNLIAGRSPGMVEQLFASGKRWKFIFIDGDHEAPGPRLDAEVCEKYAPEGALIMFHDVAAPAVADGVRYFRDKGWNVRLYHTTQIMAAAWRGEVPVPRHAPDPRVAWTIPDHLTDLAPLFEPMATSDPAPLASASMTAQAAPATPDADAEMFQRGQRLMEAGNYAEALKVFSALKGRR
ncbi:MAG: glycosyltransferase, partial [Planctomycetes bacterium]|nr:glycosyltransferase [Planctomycetota bacterium]